MTTSRLRSAVQKRKVQVARQLSIFRAQLIKRGRTYYENESVYNRQHKRLSELIAELEYEASVLDCPGEYNELPVAVVADELGLSYDQVRLLIKLGEIEATGSQAHERVNRIELERVATIGGPELLRLAEQEASEIFEQSLPLLQSGDIELAERAYRRLDARESWQGPYAPAYLVGLELAKGELKDALSSINLIYDCDEPLLRITTMTYLGRLLPELRLNDKGAQILRDQLIALAEGGSARHEPFKRSRPKQSTKKGLDELQRRAMYLTTSVLTELRKRRSDDQLSIPNFPSEISEEEFSLLIRSALYTALYAEFFYEYSTASRLYFDMTNGMIPKKYQPADLLILSEKS
jgi:hypothetical protein